MDAIEQALSFIGEYEQLHNGERPYHIMVNGKMNHALVTSGMEPPPLILHQDGTRKFAGLVFEIKPLQEHDVVIVGAAGEIRRNLI